MGKAVSRVHLWIALVVLAAVGISAVAWDVMASPAPKAWVALAVLALSAGVAHAFPVRSAYDGASYRMTNVFVVAGAVVLPLKLLWLLPLLAIFPDLWLRRGSSRKMIGLVFNVSQTVLAAEAAGLWLRVAWGGRLSSLTDLAVLFAGAALFTLVQNLLVGVVVALDSGIPLSRASTFSVAALWSDGLFGILGLLLAGIWLAKPLLLVMVPPLIVVAHRLSKNAHLAHLAQIDAKTGLYNARHFEQRLEEELVRSRRSGRPLAVLFVDIDHLRRVNNRYGHLTGDRVLRETAQALKGVCRKEDVLARFGGEEFTLLLPGAGPELALAMAERARRAVEEHPVTLDDGAALQCTVSIGVAAWPEDAADMEGLVKQADMAMYRAKHTRNTVARLHIPRKPETAYAGGAGDATVSARGGAGVAGRRFRLPRLPELVLWATVAGGAAALAWSLFSVYRTGNWLGLLPFLGLAVAAEFLQVKVYQTGGQQITLSFAIVVTLAAVTVWPAAAPLVNLASAVVHVVLTRQRRPDKVAFNLTNVPLSAAVASLVYLLISPGQPGFGGADLLAALTAAVAYYIVNVGLVSAMISLHSRQPLLQVMQGASWFGFINVVLGATGGLLGGVHAQLGVVTASLFAIPLVVLRYVLATLASRSEQAIASVQEKAHLEREETLYGLIETVATVVDARDSSVVGHSRQVAEYALGLGKELGLGQAELEKVHMAGLLHDIGKVSIPEAILHKPARLTPDEYEVIKQHAQIGRQILSGVRQLGDVAMMVGEHHERFDGAGYPAKKRGREISLGGRILAVADTLDSVLADRPYSKGRGLDWALEEIDRCAGTQFDPTVVAALHRLVATMGREFFTRQGAVAAPELKVVPGKASDAG